MKIIIIVNPTAGNGKSMKRWGKFKHKLNFTYDFHMTTSPKHATALARKCAETGESQFIIAFGGDGTAHEVIEGTLDCSNCIVGVVGAGSGNDFGRGFLSFRNAHEVNNYVQSQRAAIEMDIGLMNNQDKAYYFVNNAGIGFDAYIAYQVNKSPVKKILNKFNLGKLAYTFFLIKTLVTFKHFDLTVDMPNHTKKLEKVWFATVSNQPYFGGGMKISPQSNPADGQIELTVVHHLSRIKLLLVFVSVFFGKHTSFKEVHQMSATSFTLTTNDRMYRHTDGEYAGKTSPHLADEFSVIPKRWKMTKLT
ncbi:diacylglycerol/lipid kinase family protein [Paenisporosarcina sp.]|uniref:diacylglycerol/lipid kinase family protein n=1 Tax=Paenisporosarcina sp. TaxID=1932001 RepID=UPI003C74F9A7